MRIVSEMRQDPGEIVPAPCSKRPTPAFTNVASQGTSWSPGATSAWGPKMQGYIAMHALGLGLVCESMTFLAYREAIGIGLPVLTDADNISDACSTGDELEVDFYRGRFRNLTRNQDREVPPVPSQLHAVLEAGGTTEGGCVGGGRPAEARVLPAQQFKGTLDGTDRISLEGDGLHAAPDLRLPQQEPPRLRALGQQSSISPDTGSTCPCCRACGRPANLASTSAKRKATRRHAP